MADRYQPGAPPVAVNIATGTTIGQCSNTVVTVPSSVRTPAYTPRRPLPVVVRPPSAQSAAGQTQPAGSVSCRIDLAQTHSPVTIRAPLRSNASVDKLNFNVRVFNPDKKRDSIVYVLRDVSEAIVSTPQALMEELQKQLGPQLVPTTRQFPVGYMKSATKVSIRTEADIADIWTCAKRGEQVVLWCDGVHPKAARLEMSGSESDSDDGGPPKKKGRLQRKKRKLSAFEEKASRVEDIVGTLRARHGDRYTTIQYRLWAEMVDIGTHRLGWFAVLNMYVR